VSDVDAAAAHADAWATLAAAHRATGGATAELPGVRVMATGLAHPQWNSGDVHDPAAVDVAAVRTWYAERQVPWGLRVPAGASWPHGRHLLTKRLMVRRSGAALEAAPVDGLVVREAGPADLDGVLAVDSAAFGTDGAQTRPWLGPLLAPTADGVTVAVGAHAGEPVATAYSVLADGWAGRTLYVAGVAVVAEARRRGIGSALTAWLVDRGLSAGARWAHLSPDTDDAARLYARLGFVEVPGLDVYLDV
jgi:ribosomal protein S18 acetylase RimI-like enzyme